MTKLPPELETVNAMYDMLFKFTKPTAPIMAEPAEPLEPIELSDFSPHIRVTQQEGK